MIALVKYKALTTRMAAGQWMLLYLRFLLVHVALPRQPVEGVLEVDDALVFYGEGGALAGAADQSPKVDDGGGADVEFGIHCIHRTLNWDAGNDLTAFGKTGLNNLEKGRRVGETSASCIATEPPLLSSFPTLGIPLYLIVSTAPSAHASAELAGY